MQNLTKASITATEIKIIIPTKQGKKKIQTRFWICPYFIVLYIDLEMLGLELYYLGDEKKRP